MKNIILLIFLSTAIELSAVNPIEVVEARAYERIAKIEKMKGMWWAEPDKKLNEYNNILLERARLLDRDYSSYFTEAHVVSLPMNLSKTAASSMINSLVHEYNYLADMYQEAIALPAQKISNQDFKRLCIEVANGYADLVSAIILLKDKLQTVLG